MLERIGATGLIAAGLGAGPASATTFDEADLADVDELTLTFADGRDDRTVAVDQLEDGSVTPEDCCYEPGNCDYCYNECPYKCCYC